jgi:uncharacterized protein YjdB/alpha-tubulin suppressor-like RCC1 family protein
MKCGADVSGEQSGVATAMMPAAQERDANDAVLEALKQATLGDFEILRELGRGGMATVYLAHDIALDRKVAIKVMSPALLLMGEGMTERFKREARTAANLSHPHIIPIYTVKSSGKSLFFVMKFIAGRSLESIIKDLGPMPLPMVKGILHQVGGALGYAHRHGIVHRDVKPANIMIDEEGWAVVTDFGIAKVAENRGLTMTGIAVGTPSYMSPEQCAAKDITGKSDQYSLGVVAYEMLTGKQPFEGDSAMAIMFAHFHEQPKALTEKRADCPPEISAAVMRMLEKSPDKRFGSIEEAVGAMGAHQLTHDDPERRKLIEIAKKGSTREILRQVTPPPTSPVPPAKTRQVVEAPTTPIPTPKIISLGVTPAKSDLHVGDTMQLTATPRAAGGTAAGGRVTWNSSDPAVATVSATGLVTALAPGATTITATCDGVNGSAQITVTRVPVAAVLLSPTTPEVAEGDELQMRVTLQDQHGARLEDREVKWGVTPSGIASITNLGMVTAKREGTAEIQAESEGVKASVRLVVTPAPVAKVGLSPVEASVAAGESVTLEAVVTDRHGRRLADRELTWRSSADKIATVSSQGVVSGEAEGTAEITASAGGKQASAKIRVTPAAVASVTVEEPGPFVAGERIQLLAVVKDARGRELTGREVKWTSSSPGIATVMKDGQLTGMAPGSAKITAECEKKTGTVSVTVLQVPVASVTIEGNADPLAVGANLVLRAVVKDAKGNTLTGRAVAWASSATKLISVDSEGRVSAKAPGSATISATVEGKKAEFRVTVAAPAVPEARTEKLVTPPTPVAEAPSRRAAEPPSRPVEPPSRPVEPPSVAVEAPDRRTAQPTNRRVIGAGVGLAILAAVGFMVFGRGGDKEIPPSPPLPTAAAAVASVSVSGESGPIPVGRTRQLSALLRDAGGGELSGRPVAWTSSDPAVAAVSDLGAVTGHKPGAVTISAASEGKSGSLTVTVEEAKSDLPAAVASVAVTGSERALEVGETMQLSAIVKDAKGGTLSDRPVVWNTANPRVALVSSTGLVTATGGGSATITASSEGQGAELRVTVNAPKPAPKPPEPEKKPPPPAPVTVASVTIQPDAATIVAGGFVELNAALFDGTKQPLTDRPITWRSSDEKIARVDDGTVTGVARGTATITATAEGKSASARVTVNEATVPVTSVALTATTRTLKVGETATWRAAARDPRGRELTDRGIKWSSSAPQIASVNDHGLITAVAPGTADIRAESEGKSATERVTVSAPPPPPPPEKPAEKPETPPPATASRLPKSGVEAGGGFSCGLAQGGVVCWGGAQPGLVAIEGTAGVSGISMGRLHGCGLISGRAVCWGDNKLGQLGDGSVTTSRSAVPVAGGLTFSAISAGGGHSCGLAGGKAYCWGKGKEGQLGDGSRSDRRRPVAVRGGQSFVAISAGGNHTCALTGAGKAFCWGDGFSGQLGFGGQEQQLEPIDVSGNEKFSRIAAGGKHTCALTTGGKAYCWGSNESGQVGDGSKSDRPQPQAVGASQSFSAISTGANHTCAITAGGDAFCWGEDRFGQLGDGGKSDRPRPFAVSGGLTFTSISAGEGYTCGVAGGVPHCWGRNERGQLGDGTTAPRGLPAPVTGE